MSMPHTCRCGICGQQMGWKSPSLAPPDKPLPCTRCGGQYYLTMYGWEHSCGAGEMLSNLPRASGEAKL